MPTVQNFFKKVQRNFRKNVETPGFVFTNEEVEAYLTRQDAAAFANGSYSTLTRDQYVALMTS